LFLTITTIIVYWQVRTYDFINCDDNLYVIENPSVFSGLTFKNVIWAFTDAHAGNWHPVTWLSHMLDCQVFGLNPGRHHLTNLFFHIANTLLLFLILRMMTGALWQSGFVAALFALHPLHVESVAWIAERKDVLSTFFWMLTMYSYVRYVRAPGLERYWPVLLFFILGLMAKPMLVTLPFVLLLLDYWPLGRFNAGASHKNTSAVAGLIREKIPLFVFVAASCSITFFVQKSSGAVRSLEDFSFTVRLANALVSYGGYLAKMVWPHSLAIFYPHPGMPSALKIAGACLMLIGISYVAVKTASKHPYMIVGWLWYVGTLVPVIGLVQVGPQAMADRYTYIPLIGIFIMIAWGIPEAVASWRQKRVCLPVLGIGAVILLSALTWGQAAYWKNSHTLFKHAISVTEKNYTIHYNLGIALFDQGGKTEAITHFAEATRL